MPSQSIHNHPRMFLRLSATALLLLTQCFGVMVDNFYVHGALRSQSIRLGLRYNF